MKEKRYLIFTIEDYLTENNIKEAIAYLKGKKDGSGYDGIRLSNLEEYWKLNHDTIEQELREVSYNPGVIKRSCKQHKFVVSYDYIVCI